MLRLLIESADRTASPATMARESSIIGGRDPEERIDAHAEMLGHLLGCRTGVLAHPDLLNITLLRSQTLRLRTFVDPEHEDDILMPHDAQLIFEQWWEGIEARLPLMKTRTETERIGFAWETHLMSLCIKRHAEANGRTARAMFYMLCVAQEVYDPPLISSQYKKRYRHSLGDFRTSVFLPEMRKRGFLTQAVAA